MGKPLARYNDFKPLKPEFLEGANFLSEICTEAFRELNDNFIPQTQGAEDSVINLFIFICQFFYDFLMRKGVDVNKLSSNQQALDGLMKAEFWQNPNMN